MKRKITIFFALLSVSFAFGQGKFGKVLNSKKLALTYKSVKANEKEDYYQQYYWLVKAEQLKTFPHLQDVKPVVLYEFVKKVNPQNATKKLDARGKELRNTAELSLDQYFKNKNFQNNEILLRNLETYVDPTQGEYFTKVDAEKIKQLVPKEFFGFASLNKKTMEEVNYYLWVDKKNDKYQIVDIVPSKEDKKFYASLKQYLPKYKFETKYMPTVKKGTKTDKTDKDFFYIMPFERNLDNIEYKTDDFKTFTLSQVKREGEAWIGVEKPKK